jgi:hypothetical protein
VGRCHTFDEAADGYGRGEGFAVLVLEMQAAAVPALAVLAGSAVNSAGRSSGLTAPSGPAQQRLLVAAFAARGSSPADVDLLAVHGTGTPLGDPIETGAIGAALAGPPRAAPLVLASSKACYGHTEGAAGLAGVLLAAGALRHAVVPPVVNLRALNPYVAAGLHDWSAKHGVVAAVPRQAAPAALGAALPLAGTSSFGMSGVNAHMLLRSGTQVDSLPPTTPLVWQRQRHYPVPPAQAVLASASTGSAGSAAFACDLGSPRLAFLRDHVVGGSALVPAIAFLEVMLAAAGALAQPPLRVGVGGVSIRAPKVLDGSGSVLVCDVGTRTGTIEVRSPGGGVFVSGTACRLPGPGLRARRRPGAQLLPLRLTTPAAAGSRMIAALAGALDDAPGAAYSLHPAPADAALHLGAVKLAGQKGSAARVPVGIGALGVTAPADAALRSGQWALTAPPDMGGSSDVGALLDGGSLAVRRLVSKELAPQRGRAREQAVVDEDEFERRNFSYAVEWRASTAAAPGAGAAPGRRLVADGIVAALPDAAHGRVAAAGLQVLQAIAARCKNAAALTAPSAPGQPGRGGGAASSAVLVALMKVAAAEEPHGRWATIVCDPNARVGAAASTAAGADEHGLVSSAHVVSAPTFVRAPM